MSRVADAFGTPRGLVRLLLSYPQALLLPRPQLDGVDRLVFVCLGNICRSPYAEAVARQLGVRTASFGLDTQADRPAHPPIVSAAADAGIDLTAHRATTAAAFQPQSGDLLIVMEVRQLAELDGYPALAHLPRTLLGRWARPPMPHLHDPYGLSPAYAARVLRRIEGAVARLARACPKAASPPSPARR